MSYGYWVDKYYDRILEEWNKSGRLQSFNAFAFMKFNERKDND